MDVRYVIDDKKGYLVILNSGLMYPLSMCEELKTQHDQTWQEFANAIYNIGLEESCQ